MADNLEASGLGAQLLADAEAIGSEIQDWRREFHQFPELAFEENITASKIMRVLESIEGMKVIAGFAITTCVIGVLRDDLEGPALVLRTCTDAIELEEMTGAPFASCIPGVMHATGHDAHMASLLGAAKILSRYADKLTRKVVFLFQPAGEGRGGARTLVENRFLEEFNVGRCIGLSWWPELTYGQLYTRKGVLTALSDKIHIDIRGVAGHAAEPHVTVDPISIAGHLIVAIQTMLTRDVDPQETALVSFGRMESGFAYNVIPEQAHLWGTFRAFNPKTRDFVQKRLETLVPAVAKAFRAVASVEYTRNYGQVDNDPEFLERVLEIAVPFFGNDGINILEKPLMSGEDFSFLSSCVPSVFLLIGTGLEYGLNQPVYDIPESMLPFSAAWEAYMALKL
jgi:amidohydrolase